MMRNFIKMFLSALRALEFLHGLGQQQTKLATPKDVAG
jgi:hypothetical protein